MLNSDYQPGLDFYKSISFAIDISEELIFRIAGELPEKQEFEPIREKIIAKFAKLADADQELIIDFLDYLIIRKSKANN